MTFAKKIMAALLGTAFATAALAADKVQLTVYTALETDQLKAYQTAFNQVQPDIEIKWVRDSTGVITAKLLAEQATRRPMWCGAWPPPAWPCCRTRACWSPTRR
jgi:iron(III) transport system substrate-binding protein